MSDNEIEFSEEYGLWWPMIEMKRTLFGYMLNRVTDVDLAINHVRTKGVCVQAGGFIGMWPMRLAKFFERVYTFEPSPVHFECVKRNTAHLPGVMAQQAVLGPTNELVDFVFKQGGASRVRGPTAEPRGQSIVKQVTIDSLGLVRCDAIFLDVERYEIPALEGALETIEKWSPVITVEFKDDTREVLEAWMKKHRYARVCEVHGDWIFTRQK